MSSAFEEIAGAARLLTLIEKFLIGPVPGGFPFQVPQSGRSLRLGLENVQDVVWKRSIHHRGRLQKFRLKV